MTPAHRTAFASRPPRKRSGLFTAGAILVLLPAVLAGGLQVAQATLKKPGYRFHQVTLSNVVERGLEVSLDVLVQRRTDGNVNVKVKFRGPESETAGNDHERMFPGQGQEWDLFGDTRERSETLTFAFPDRESAGSAAAFLRGLVDRKWTAEFPDVNRIYLFTIPDRNRMGHRAWIEIRGTP